MEFKESLKACRKKAGFTQLGLAVRAGLTREWISQYETGRRLPALPKLIILADALDVTLDELVRRNHERTRK